MLQSNLIEFGGFELDLLYLAIMISLLITGPGFLSIERNFLKREMFPKSPKYSTTITKNKKDGSLN
jgi:hypothetical protein